MTDRDDAADSTLTPPPGEAASEPHPSPASLARSLATQAGLLVVCAVFWVKSRDFDKEVPAGQLGPAFFPRLLVILLVLCVLFQVAQELRSYRRERSAMRGEGEPVRATDVLELGVGAEEGAIAEEDYPIHNRALAIGCAIAVGYILATMYLGYPLATLLVIVSFVWTASKPTWAALAVAVTTALVFPYIFVKVVFIALPTGVWVFDDFTVWLYNLLGIY